MRLRLLPHATALDAFTFDQFVWSVEDGNQFSFDQAPQEWDYRTAMSVGCAVGWDPELLSEFPVDQLAVAIVVDCPGTGMRWYGQALLDGAGARRFVEVEIPAGEASGALETKAWVVCPGGDEALRLPPGAKVAWSERGKLYLEGTGPRFPTEAVSFKALRLPEGAAWHIRVDIHDLDEALGSCIRVLVNTDHRSSGVLLAQDHQQAPLLTNILRRDIVTAVLRELSANDDVDLAGYDPELTDSVGTTVSSWCESYLRMSLVSAAQHLKVNPTRFDSDLQQGIGFLDGGLG